MKKPGGPLFFTAPSRCWVTSTSSAVLSSLAVATELAAGTLRQVPVTGVDLRRTLMAVWTGGRRLTGPAGDLYTIVARTGRHVRAGGAPGLSGPTGSRARRPPEP